MSRNARRFDRRPGLAGALALPLGLLLSACGGGGGGDSRVASIPPPPIATPTPTPTPQANTLDLQFSWLTSPATRNGRSDIIGRLALTPGNGDPSTVRGVGPGEFTMDVLRYFDDDPFPYTLQAPAGALPRGLTSLNISAIWSGYSWTINLPPAPSFREGNYGGDFMLALGQRLTAFSKAPDGTATQFLSDDFTRGSATSVVSMAPDRNLQTTLLYDIGYSHVAMGEWSWRVVDLNGTAAGDSGELLFVNGDRTPSSDIPVSGTATYDARSLALLSGSGTPGIPFTLTADFGQRIMSTRIDQDYQYNSASPTGDPILGIHVSGAAPFTNSGLFDIPLSGTANYASTNLLATPPAEPVTGMMNGAFFGPQAQQVGGVFSLQRPGGTLLMQDAFVGQQRRP